MRLRRKEGNLHSPTQAKHRLSLVRLLIVIGCSAALVVAGSSWALTRYAESNAVAANTWSAPYVDVTLTPVLHFEDPAEQPAKDVVLGFVVADPTDACTPSWGTYYNLDAAARALDLDRRIVRLRERGGDAIVSFGGAQNNELATVCKDTDQLIAAYQSVIDRYGITAIDFDIEGVAVADQVSNARRADAIERLQGDNPNLAVWFTLPVAPQGLTADAIALVDGALQAGVELSGLNVMTMNYGESRPSSMSMSDASIAALVATEHQLDSAYQRTGSPKPEQALWEMLGATPMIGQNDLSGDVFRTSDAEALMAFAKNVNLRRVSYWSANRDIACGAAVNDDRVSNTCSGVSQQPLDFAHIFAGGATRNRTALQTPAAGQTLGPNDVTVGGLARDDPRTSPYPIWRSPAVYEANAKVVWQGRVYEAKWWTQGNQPDAPVKHEWDTPWRYLGPVLESDREAVAGARSVIAGSQVPWAAEKVFVAGDEVKYDNKIFRAKWWTQGEPPQEYPDQPYDHPWEYLGDAPAPPK